MKRSFAIIVLLISKFVVAQSGQIEGFVFTADSTNSIPGVNVYLKEIGVGTQTNGSGFFEIKSIQSGTYTLVFSSIGYVKQTAIVVVSNQNIVLPTVHLKESVSELKEFVVMTNGNTAAKNIPGAVTYLALRDIQKFNYSDANRLLRTIPGVNIQEEDGFGLRPNIGLRGAGVERSSKITLMEDGILIAPAPYSDPSAYYFPTIGRMQGVEVMKGSSQIQYGPFTTGGAINFVSTQIPDTFSGKINVSGGSFGLRKVHAFVGNSSKHFGFSIETFQFAADGFKELDNNGNTGFKKQDYVAKFRVNTKEGNYVYQSLQLKLSQAEEVSNETYLGLTLADFNATPLRRYSASQLDQMNSDQNLASLTHTLKIGTWLKVSTTAYHTNFTRNWYKLDKVSDSTSAYSLATVLDNPNEYVAAYNVLIGNDEGAENKLTLRNNNRKYDSQGIQTVVDIKFETQEFKHSIQLGARLHSDGVDRFQWDDAYEILAGEMYLTTAGIPGTESNRINTGKAFASYAQYKLAYKKLTLTSGIRLEKIKFESINYGKNDIERVGVDAIKAVNTATVMMPGVGLDYNYSKYLSAFGGVHKGFSPPGTAEGSKPEESVNYEIGARYNKNTIASQLVFFITDYKNLLGSDQTISGGQGTGEQFNAGAVRTSGVEFTAMYDLLSSNKRNRFSLPLQITYTYTSAIFKTTFSSDFDSWGNVAAGDEFPYLNKHQLAVMLGFEYKRLTVNVAGRYIDAMRTEPGQGALEIAKSTDDAIVLDFSANYDLSKSTSIFGSVTNATNAIYRVADRPAGYRPAMPRAVIVGLKTAF